eukprot:7638330-Alexandrium_andersonii.AAC.1
MGCAAAFSPRRRSAMPPTAAHRQPRRLRRHRAKHDNVDERLLPGRKRFSSLESRLCEQQTQLHA